MATSLNQAYFALDVPDIVFTASGERTIRIQLMSQGTTLYSTSEKFYPDTQGNITLHHLGELAQTYLSACDLSLLNEADGVSRFRPTAQLLVQMYNGDTLIDSATCIVYYSKCRTSIDPFDYDNFLSHGSVKYISPEEPLLFSHFLLGDHCCRATLYWLHPNGTVRKTTVPLASPSSFSENDICQYHYHLSNIITQCSSAASYNITVDMALSVDVNLFDNDESEDAIDCITFFIDHHRRQSTAFLFTNCFGCLENVSAIGADERVNEMTAEFGYINGQYKKTSTILTPSHTVNSGYISESTYQNYLDLAQSPEVCLLTSNGSMGEQVTITSISYVDKQPRYEGVNVTVTYRPVEKTSQVVTRTFQRPLIRYDAPSNSIQG